jgi:hypothetical protein
MKRGVNPVAIHRRCVENRLARAGRRLRLLAKKFSVALVGIATG